MHLPFTLLSPGVGIGAPVPDGWEPIASMPLLVIVGVTGVGKSTALAELQARGFDYHLLPDRRDLTDRLIIAAMQTRAGEAVAPVKDRRQRFAYTRAYRDLFPGGMAHALTQLLVDPALLPGVLLFDGLRGADEATHAAALLPLAHFIVLEAPDAVRVARLVGRADPFDQVAGTAVTTPEAEGIHSFADVGAADAVDVFSPDEEQALLNLVRSGAVPATSLQSALAIVLEERRNYDPAAATAALREYAPTRTLVVDTVRLPAVQVAAAIERFALRTL